MITIEKFRSIISDVNWAYAKPYVSLFSDSLDEFDINTSLRKSHFLAQISYESAGFKAVNENLNYSFTALYNNYRTHFPTIATAKLYERQPEKIANILYASRLGNGNEESGDGWKYRGRGLIQLTGKKNYNELSNFFQKDFINNPDLLTDPEWALKSACWFWKINNINKWADKDNPKKVTKIINGGYTGLENRLHFLVEYKKLFGLMEA